MDAASLLALIEQLQSHITALETSSPISSVTSSSSRNIKTTKPDTFHGSRSKLRSFIIQLAIYFALQPDDFNTDVNKIMFAASLLRDSAFDWFEPVMGGGRSRQAFYALIVLFLRQLTHKTLAWTSRRPLLV